MSASAHLDLLGEHGTRRKREAHFPARSHAVRLRHRFERVGERDRGEYGDVLRDRRLSGADDDGRGQGTPPIASMDHATLPGLTTDIFC